jgi:hypothetical protein
LPALPCPPPRCPSAVHSRAHLSQHTAVLQCLVALPASCTPPLPPTLFWCPLNLLPCLQCGLHPLPTGIRVPQRQRSNAPVSVPARAVFSRSPGQLHRVPRGGGMPLRRLLSPGPVRARNLLHRRPGHLHTVYVAGPACVGHCPVACTAGPFGASCHLVPPAPLPSPSPVVCAGEREGGTRARLSRLPLLFPTAGAASPPHRFNLT